jgi:hypothetical protein
MFARTAYGSIVIGGRVYVPTRRCVWHRGYDLVEFPNGAIRPVEGFGRNGLPDTLICQVLEYGTACNTAREEYVLADFLCSQPTYTQTIYGQWGNFADR